MPTPRHTTKERRAELADAALEIIATRGIVELTTRSLAEAVGITTGAIFRHFASLDALLVAVAEHVGDVLDSTYPPTGLPPRKQLERFVEARSTVVGTRAGVLRLVLSEQFALALPATAARRLRAAIDATRAFLVKTIADAQAAKQLRSDIAPETLAVIVMGTIQMLGLANHSHARREDHANAIRVALLQLLTTPIEPKRRRT